VTASFLYAKASRRSIVCCALLSVFNRDMSSSENDLLPAAMTVESFKASSSQMNFTQCRSIKRYPSSYSQLFRLAASFSYTLLSHHKSSAKQMGSESLLTSGGDPLTSLSQVAWHAQQQLASSEVCGHSSSLMRHQRPFVCQFGRFHLQQQ
jgi:hypothetical protein